VVSRVQKVLEHRRLKASVGVAVDFSDEVIFHSSENRDSEAQHKTFFDFFAYKMRANCIRFRVQSSCQRHKKVCQWVKLRS
jgi:hypothetical protein